ncbi:hypothetical protein C9374_012241 [Naegleria lovaniensis]|uniref:VPS9 domain-containing protein n=1 Tax=Naegleria lovaniensis TaxID=51637 RepID=A0AA88GDE4_NAELO|nr:uncharacterized protein C9374_012241 [Naegleria lovaniensis]KAG2373375.1 hypothetical protein C9374_012241 [Naegleria lovaniensis]
MNTNNEDLVEPSTSPNDMNTESSTTATTSSSSNSTSTITDSTVSLPFQKAETSVPEEQPHQIAQNGQSHDSVTLDSSHDSSTSNTSSNINNAEDPSKKRPTSAERPRKALPRPNRVPSDVFTFDPELHEESLGKKKGAEFLMDHGDSSSNDATTTSSTEENLTSQQQQHQMTPPVKVNQRRWSHKRSASEAYSFTTPPSASSIISTTPSTPQLLPSSSTATTSTTGGSQEKTNSESSRKKFTLFGFTFGSSSSSSGHNKGGSSLHSLAPNVSSSSTPTLATSPITSSTSTCSDTLQITSSVTSSCSDNTPTSESNSNEVKKVVQLDEETMKKRQGVHMATPLNNFISDEQPSQRNTNEIDLLGFLKTASLDDNSLGRPSSASEMDKTDISTNRETTTSGLKTFLDKMRGKSIFTTKISSPVPFSEQESVNESNTGSSTLSTTPVNDDSISVSQKAPKKLSEKEMRRLKLLERENNQKEMMDNILEKINKNGESFAHLSFFDENDQEWQYIGYIQKYDSSMTDDEIYMMYALMGVGAGEDGGASAKKEKDVKDFSGGIYGDSCVCPVLSRLCGRGELRYPNGSVYEGDIIRGKRHGFGKMIFPYKSTIPTTSKKSSAQTEQAPPTAIAIGQWVCNNPSEAIPFKVTYSNELEYWGTFRAKAKLSSAYTIGINDLEKHKEGELYHVIENKKYFGGFKEDLKDGFGVEVMANGERYYGGWKNGLYHYTGTYQYIDGTYYQGEFKRGSRKGKGKLYLATGDVIEGTWNGDKVESAVFKKGTAKNVELTHLFQLRTQINEAIKLFQNVGHMDDNNYLQFLKMTKKENIERPELEMKWKYYSLMSKETWRKEREKLTDFYGKYEKYDLTDKVTFKNEVLRLLGESIKTDGPAPPVVSFVKSFIEFFDSLYHGSYYAGNNRGQSGARKITSKKDGVLLYNAIDDLKSYIIYLCDQVVWDYFGNEILSSKLLSNGGGAANHSGDPSEMQFVEQDEQFDECDDEIIFGNSQSVGTNFESSKLKFSSMSQAYNFCKTIIADHLHKKLYSTTFELYEYHFRDQDLLINQKINSIISTCNLQNFGVHSDFISTNTPLHISMKKVKIENKKLKKQKAGQDDFENVESDDWQPGADDVTSLYTYTFIKTNIGNYTALFNYINDWKPPHTSLRPVSHVISFFEGFLNYIVDLDPNLTVKQSELGENIGENSDDTYVFISKYGLTKQLERGIELEIFRNQSKKEKIERQLQKPNLTSEELQDLNQQQREVQLISFSWVSPLLLFVSLQVGHFQLQISRKTDLKSSLSGNTTTKLFTIDLSDITTSSEQNMVVPMVDGSGNMLNLAQALLKYRNLVKNVLDNAKLGFNITLKHHHNGTSNNNDSSAQDSTNHSTKSEYISIEFDKEPFPSYVYSELSLEIAKFIKFELENSDSRQYRI